MRRTADARAIASEGDSLRRLGALIGCGVDGGMAAATEGSKLDRLPDVDIPDEGTFKFVRVKVTDPDTGASKEVVRG